MKENDLKALKKEMKLKGYGIKELADRLGVSKTTICKWRKGDFLPNPENVEALKGLGFSDVACLDPSKEVAV